MVKTAQPKVAFRASSVTPPQLTRRVAPIYPPFAKQMHMKSERVVLNATIGKDGSVTEVKLVRGKQVFVDSAMSAVRQWKYKPAYLNGDPISASIEIDLDFNN
jgi:protein TonB